MIKKAMEYVNKLTKKGQEIITKEIDGKVYIKGDYDVIPLDTPDTLYLNTLNGLVDYVREMLENSNEVKPFLIEPNYDTVRVHSGLDERKDRTSLVFANTQSLDMKLDYYVEMEEFIIQLKSCFVETENLNRLVSIVSHITNESKVELQDDGFGLSVTQSSGVAIKQKENLSINPIVRLAPYRTFLEVEQPESCFLLRVKDGGRMMLKEADGGAWKLEAQRNVSNYLKEQLAEEIEQGLVKVIG